MLICNNGNVGKKSSHKAFRTSKFLESARKRRRRWSIKQISLGAFSVLLFCSAQGSALCSAQFLIPSDNFDVIPSTWCLREHQVLPHFKNIVWNQIDQCWTLQKHSIEKSKQRFEDDRAPKSGTGNAQPVWGVRRCLLGIQHPNFRYLADIELPNLRYLADIEVSGVSWSWIHPDQMFTAYSW